MEEVRTVLKEAGCVGEEVWEKGSGGRVEGKGTSKEGKGLREGRGRLKKSGLKRRGRAAGKAVGRKVLRVLYPGLWSSAEPWRA